jgi:uncharacterized membrane protein YoaK (UPF0700 family)
VDGSAVAIDGAGAGHLRHPLARALLVLTFTTGLVDAVSYLGLGRVFTANMTGNIVLLGFGLAGGTGLPVVAPLVSLAAFLLGALAGGRLTTRVTGRRPAHLVVPLIAEAALVLGALILAALLDVRAGAVSAGVLIALLAFGMGIRNAAARKLAVPDLTTTVLTLTLTGLAADSPLAGGTGKGSARRVAAAAAMLLGALAGALLLKTGLWLALAATLVLVLATCGAYSRVE